MADLENVSLLGNRLKKRSRFRICLYVGIFLLILAAAATVLSTAVFYGLRSRYLYRHAAVAADAAQCSVIGTDILWKGGTAVDAAIASCLCLGVVNLHSTGIGGGGFMVVYNATTNTSTVIDFREVAPMSAYEDMYNEDPNLGLNGVLAIAVPGQLKGLSIAHQKYGHLHRSELFAPSIKLAQEGFKVTKTIENAIKSIKDFLADNNTVYDGIRELLMPDGQPLKEGDLLRRPALAETLQLISDHGFDYFYNNTNMTADMVEEINAHSGNYSVEDFLDYTARERDTTQSTFNDYVVLSTPPPSSGSVLSMMLSILEGYDFTSSSLDGQTYHYIVEAFKLSYAYRILLGDPEFNVTVKEVMNVMLNKTRVDELRQLLINGSTTYPPEHYTIGSPFHIPIRKSTSHLSVLADNGDAVAVTTTINTYFGSKVRSKKYGFIYNNEMGDFSIPGVNEPDDDLPPGPANYIEPRKRPQSSTTPTVILAPGQPRRVAMVVGASGGSHITTGVAQVILNVLLFEKGLVEGIDMRRLHHQLIPDVVSAEKGFSEEFIHILEDKGHEVENNVTSLNVVQGIYVPTPGSIYAYSDERKGGEPDGY